MRVLLLLCLVPVAAGAAPTGLNQIPTTDLVPEKQLTLQLQNGNTEVSGRSSLVHRPEPVAQSEFGLPWNLEAGLDVAPSDPPHDYRPAMNLKWNPVREDFRIPAVAVGAAQLGVGFSPSYFLVLSKTLNYGEIEYQKFGSPDHRAARSSRIAITECRHLPASGRRRGHTGEGSSRR